MAARSEAGAVPLVVQVRGGADGWRISAARPGQPAADGLLSGEGLARVEEAVSAVEDPERQPVLLLVGDDQACTVLEEAAGAALGEALCGSDELVSLFAKAQGAAEALREPLLLALDVRGAGLPSWPWECLALGGSRLEADGAGVLVRLEPGRDAPAPKGPLQVVRWCADPDDVHVARLVDAADHACRAAGLPLPVPPEQADPHAARIVLLVAHGEAEADLLALLADDGSVAPGSIAHALQPALSGAVLAVALICEGGLRPAAAADGLVRRLLAAGARACVASEERLAVDAGEALVERLLPALSGGATVASAVAAGRRAVRELASPAPDARWWRLALTVGSIQAAAWRHDARSAPAGWSLAPATGALLRSGGAQADQRSHGFLGVEHLALALLAQPASGALLPLRARLRQAADPLRAHLEHYLPAPGAPGRLSPRLQRVGAALPPDASPDNLAQALLRDAGRLLCSLLALPLPAAGLGDDETLPQEDLDALLGDAGTVDDATLEDATLEDDGLAALLTLDAAPAPVPLGGPWSVLEVVGGPEDGRRIRLAVGEGLGRAGRDAKADVLLYDDAGATDAFLSRRHLERADGDAVLMVRPGRLRRDGRTVAVRKGAKVVLQAGDLLGLSPGTWLLARAAMDGDALE